MAQMVENISSKDEALISNTNLPKIIKNPLCSPGLQINMVQPGTLFIS
jgi:hypothetical protein